MKEGEEEEEHKTAPTPIEEAAAAAAAVNIPATFTFALAANAASSEHLELILWQCGKYIVMEKITIEVFFQNGMMHSNLWVLKLKRIS